MVVDADPEADVQAGTEVVVTGTVQESFATPEIEDLLDVQLEDEILGEFEARPYIEASGVDADPDAA